MDNITASALLGVISKDKDTIYCRRSFVNITDSINTAILLNQILYWWGIKGKKPFYKFRSPCTSDLYKEGDSWCEELCFKPKEFDSALDVIATKITRGMSKASYEGTKFPQPNEGESYAEYTKRFEATLKCCVFYWTDKNRITWYEVNVELLGHFVAAADEHKVWGLRELRSRAFSKRAKELAALPRASRSNNSSDLNSDLIADSAITEIANLAITLAVADSAITYSSEITPEITSLSSPSENPSLLAKPEAQSNQKPNPAYQLFIDKNSEATSDPLELASQKPEASAAQKGLSDYTKLPDDKHDDKSHAAMIAMAYGGFGKIDKSEQAIISKALKGNSKVKPQDHPLSKRIAECIPVPKKTGYVPLAAQWAVELKKGWYDPVSVPAGMDEKLYKSSPFNLYDTNPEFVQFVEQVLGFWAFPVREQVVRAICNYDLNDGKLKGWIAYWKSTNNSDDQRHIMTREQIQAKYDNKEIDRIAYESLMDFNGFEYA